MLQCVFKIKGSAMPWVSDDIIDEMKYRDKLHKGAVSMNCNTTCDLYRQARNKVTTLIRNAKREYFIDNISSNSCTKLNLWQSMKLLLDNKNSLKL